MKISKICKIEWFTNSILPILSPLKIETPTIYTYSDSPSSALSNHIQIKSFGLIKWACHCDRQCASTWTWPHDSRVLPNLDEWRCSGFCRASLALSSGIQGSSPGFDFHPLESSKHLSTPIVDQISIIFRENDPEMIWKSPYK